MLLAIGQTLYIATVY